MFSPVKKILLIEDLPHDTYLTQQALEKSKHKFQIFTAKDGWDALILMKNEDFDFILLDLKMPRIDGFSTMKLMRGYQLQTDVPLIVLSNSVLVEDREQAKKLGASEYVEKDLDFLKFTKSLLSVMENYEIKKF